ncbi:MAG: sulfotransferase family protein [Chitinophagales bacterium]
MSLPGTNKIIFIVGNSRSGTTMMRRVLGNHPEIYMLEELHFFEQLWSTSDKEREIEAKEALELASKLLFIQRDGYLSEMNVEKYKTEAEDILKNIPGKIFSHLVLEAFLFYEARKHFKVIPCEKTPQDVFYIQEILELFPQCKIINMVRDPRGVMLSQKRKWQRREMGAKFMTKKEQRRLKINYHPITISKLWNSSVRSALRFKNHLQVHHMIFEKLVNNSEHEIKRLCKFLEIEFTPEMLSIPQVGSSNEADLPESFGIKTERAGNWEKGGLNKTEIYFCQNICGEYMQQFGYDIKEMKPGVFSLLYYYISFPVKIVLAILFNLHRMKNIVEAIKRRLK